MRDKKNKGKDIVDRILKDQGSKKLSDISPETIAKGKEFIDRFMEVYGEIPMVDIVSGTWENRKKTNLIKWMMLKSSVNVDGLAEYLGCTKQYLNNKFNRDSFSIDDLIIAAYACNFTLALLENDGKCKCRVMPEEYFDTNPEVLARITKIRNFDKESKRVEYEQKKAELERMKKEYGFE
ncbi:MAG: hypothetical protein J6X94_10855 [Lachnospiraceae bacterium]|nr:hypothetical protein [Lachnospiraceae bacterium]